MFVYYILIRDEQATTKINLIKCNAARCQRPSCLSAKRQELRQELRQLWQK